MKKNKKAEYGLQDIPWIVVILGIGIISFAVATQITSEIKTDYDRPGQAVVNESDAVTLLWGNNTNMSLDHQYVSSVVVANVTDGSQGTIGAGNYTVFSYEGKIQCNTNGSGNASERGGAPKDGEAVFVNYTFEKADEVYNITVKGGYGQKNFSNWFVQIGLVIGAVIIITILMILGYIQRK